ncbi:urocortin-3 isoform X2 [Oenanthe melanoleuca]|uniref:urocortin-3 isoform X2 n=1 Tax=Oenanthe melanoleuca TaxID=2939378 RepID=UPI0024C1C0F8|nr:urocortin-3 isoform X2 [Oenanthe melanoleuca]
MWEKPHGRSLVGFWRGEASAMSHPRLLLLLVLLGATSTSRALSLSSAASILSCLKAALAEAQRIHLQENAALDKRQSPSLEEASEEEDGEEEELGKRTFPGDGHSKHVSQGKAKSHQNRAKSDRRAKVTLSLDVPTNIMNILFNIAKAKNLRAKAAANAHLMAQIGRRK